MLAIQYINDTFKRLHRKWKDFVLSFSNYDPHTIYQNVALDSPLKYQVIGILISILVLITAYLSPEIKFQHIPLLLPYLPFVIALFICFYTQKNGVESKFLKILWFAFNFYCLSLWSISLLVLNDFSLTHFLVFGVNLAALLILVNLYRCIAFLILGYLFSYAFINLFTHFPTTDLYNTLFATALGISGVGTVFMLSQYDRYSQEEEIIKQWEAVRLHDEEYNRQNNEENDKAIQEDNERNWQNLSHEFRTPMIHVVTAFKALGSKFKKKDIPAKENMAITLNVIQDSLDALFGFTEETMESFEYKSVNLIELVNKVIKKYKAERPNVEFLLDDHAIFDKNIDAIAQCHEETITKALDNLIVNSLNANAMSVTVEIKKADQLDTKKSDYVEQLQITVIDDGYGFEEEIIESAFASFIKGSESQGLGLGLTLANRIITFHLGEIKIQNNYGVGASVSFTLPKSRKGTEKL